jgi:hypothetical protein
MPIDWALHGMTSSLWALARSRAARRPALVATMGRYRVLARPRAGRGSPAVCDAGAQSPARDTLRDGGPLVRSMAVC